MGSTAGTAARLEVAFLGTLCALLLWAGPAVAAPKKPLPAPVPVAQDALARAVQHGELTEAQYALERARSLFRLRSVRARFGEVVKPDPHAATAILRDLALRLRALSPAERAQAEALLSRPTDGTYPDEHHYDASGAYTLASWCDGVTMCVHWVSTPGHRDTPPLGEAGGDPTIPDWVEATIAVFQNVWATEVGAFGYRAPRSDASSPNNQGSGLFDVYLADIGGDAIPLFGYCTTDDPSASDLSYRYFAFSSYCVLDNDFSQAQFGVAHTPEEFLQVTAAHEFFHAIQFAYDAAEDLWLMEGTAAWIEDEVYPAINDNVPFLQRSALTSPATPVDRGDSGFEYGAWLFFRFLSEQLVVDRAIVREIWTIADGSEFSAFDDYSLHAVRVALAARGKPWRAAFARFARTNRTRAYGESSLYPMARTARSWALRPARVATRWQASRIPHAANRFYSFTPGKGVRSHHWLRVTVDLPPTKTGSTAGLLVFSPSGSWRFVPIRLNRRGNGRRGLEFRRDRVARVDLVLTNSSTRFELTTCWQAWTSYSCGGAIPKDDLRIYRFRADLIRR